MGRCIYVGIYADDRAAWPSLPSTLKLPLAHMPTAAVFPAAVGQQDDRLGRKVSRTGGARRTPEQDEALPGPDPAGQSGKLVSLARCRSNVWRNRFGSLGILSAWTSHSLFLWDQTSFLPAPAVSVAGKQDTSNPSPAFPGFLSQRRSQLTACRQGVIIRRFVANHTAATRLAPSPPQRDSQSRIHSPSPQP